MRFGSDALNELGQEVKMLGAMLIGAFVLLIGPLAYFFGADSRLTTLRDRGR